MKINKCLSQVQAVVHKIIFIVALLEILITFKNQNGQCTYFTSSKIGKKSKSKLVFERKIDALFKKIDF